MADLWTDADESMKGKGNMETIIMSDIKDGIAVITLNRPEKKNALSIKMRDEVVSALMQLAGNPDVKVVVITGAGNTFSAGFDLKEFQQSMADPAFNGRLWASSDRFHHTLLFYPLPVIAAVNGPAIAGGFDLAVMCDLRICSTEATFSHPEISFGPVLYSPLHDLVGGAVARELCLTGRLVNAEEALSLKLVSGVIPADDLSKEVARATTQITQASREHLMQLKSKIIQRAGVAGKTTLAL